MEEDGFVSFIRTCVRSVWALELLLLIKRQPKAWNVAELSQELRANTSLVQGVLATFEAAGLVVPEGADGYLFQPVSPALRACCDRLEQAYRERPVATVNLIVASAAGTLQSFADAFRLKGDDK